MSPSNGNDKNNRVVLWWATLCDDKTTDEDDADMFALLDREERVRADRFRRPADRRHFIVAHGLVRLLLEGLTGISRSALRFDRMAGEKPRVAGHSGLDFSLTHTHGLVACAAAIGMRVGLDAEPLDSVVPAMEIAQSRFSPAEAELVERGGQEAFVRLWTLKESFLKATGEGLRRPLQSVEFRLDPPRLQHPSAEAWHFAQWRPAARHLLSLTIGVDSQGLPPIIDITSYTSLHKL